MKYKYTYLFEDNNSVNAAIQNLKLLIIDIWKNSLLLFIVNVNFTYILLGFHIVSISFLP